MKALLQRKENKVGYVSCVGNVSRRHKKNNSLLKRKTVGMVGKQGYVGIVSRKFRKQRMYGELRPSDVGHLHVLWTEEVKKGKHGVQRA